MDRRKLAGLPYEHLTRLIRLNTAIRPKDFRSTLPQSSTFLSPQHPRSFLRLLEILEGAVAGISGKLELETREIAYTITLRDPENSKRLRSSKRKSARDELLENEFLLPLDRYYRREPTKVFLDTEI